MATLRVLSMLVSAALAAPAGATVVEIPITVDTRSIEQILEAAMFTQPDGSARVFDDGSGCNQLVLADARVSANSDHVRILSRGVGRVGKRIGDRCLLLSDWDGFLEVLLDPVLADDRTRIEFRVVDSAMYNRRMEKGLWNGIIWSWSKRYAHPLLERLAIELQPALTELHRALNAFMPADPDGLRLTLREPVILDGIRTTPAGVATALRLNVPEALFAHTSAPEAALHPEELAAFARAWQQWDAFLTFAIKQVAGTTDDPALRAELLEVLLEARWELAMALAAPVDRTRDPVRALFVQTWKRLAPTLRRMVAQRNGAAAMRLLSFVAAGDALQAIDALGPHTGWELSTDGLRRMARLIAPATPIDPLEYRDDVDPALRELFGFGPPLPAIEPHDAPASRTHSGLISSAWAAARRLRTDVDQLNRWTPNRENLHEYLGAVRMLLHEIVDRTVEEQPLEADQDRLFRPLVLATAWQETCWRQYVEKQGKLAPLQSAAGAVGIMQVMPTVWRGFYAPDPLKFDIAYNATAGSEILHHYFVKYAVRRGEHQHSGGLDNLARATYAAYNGGPRHLGRYRDSATSASLRRIDQAFWDKYQTVREGDELAVARCYDPPES